MPKHLKKCAWRPNFSNFGSEITKISMSKLTFAVQLDVPFTVLHTIPKGNDRFTGRVSRHYTDKIKRFDTNTYMILEDFIVKNISSASQDTPCALIIFLN